MNFVNVTFCVRVCGFAEFFRYHSLRSLKCRTVLYTDIPVHQITLLDEI